MPIFENVNGTWKATSKIFPNISNSYKQTKKVFANVNGVWKEGYSGTENLLYEHVDVNTANSRKYNLLDPATFAVLGQKIFTFVGNNYGTGLTGIDNKYYSSEQSGWPYNSPYSCQEYDSDTGVKLRTISATQTFGNRSSKVMNMDCTTKYLIVAGYYWSSSSGDPITRNYPYVMLFDRNTLAIIHNDRPDQLGCRNGGAYTVLSDTKARTFYDYGSGSSPWEMQRAAFILPDLRTNLEVGYGFRSDTNTISSKTSISKSNGACTLGNYIYMVLTQKSSPTFNNKCDFNTLAVILTQTSLKYPGFVNIKE